MVYLTIPEMHKKLEELNDFFIKETQSFSTSISLHEGQLTPSDYNQFATLLDEIKKDAFNRINQFYSIKFGGKCQVYDRYVQNFTGNSEAVNSELIQFREQLEQATIDLKKQQNRKENLLDHFSKNYSEHVVLKKAWKWINKYKNDRIEARELDRKMDELYCKNLMKRSFFPWRTLTYKDGYENTVKRETERDIMNIHQQYQSIIDLLKNKINSTDEVIKIKRAAKGEFAFALSKNLLKTISNLSMEVMSLNQMSLRDGEQEEYSTRQFMKSVDNVIQEKLNKVKEYKKGLTEYEVEGEEGQEKKKKKKITFI